MFSFVVGTSGNVGNITGEFYNTSLYFGSGASPAFTTTAQSNTEQYFGTSFLMEDKRW